MTVPSSPSAAAAAAPAAPAAAAITAHLPQLPLELQRVSHRTRPESLTIEPPNPLWPVHYERLRDRIQSALGPGTALLSIAHVGSTSIPGLFAKPVIDIDIVVADPADEGSYVAALVGKGWEETGTGRGRGQEAEGEGEGEADAGGVGLQFLFREPAWYDHRFFVREDGEGEPKANVHVFGPGCPEVVRHRIFKEWLLEVSALTDTALFPVASKLHPSFYRLCILFLASSLLCLFSSSFLSLARKKRKAKKKTPKNHTVSLRC